ncbi:MAG: hypothetical protein QM726_04810 [Chitinophagaceae bacterium]
MIIARLSCFVVTVVGFVLVHGQQTTLSAYPTTKGYLSVIHPLFTIDRNGTQYNFSGTYTVGFPCGIQILKSDKLGFTFELTPFIKSDGSNSKMTNLLFHPGIMCRYKHGFGITYRMAFETSGRYGFTTIFGKTIIKTKANSYFIAIPLPLRFGNNLPPSAGLGIQLGVVF